MRSLILFFCLFFFLFYFLVLVYFNRSHRCVFIKIKCKLLLMMLLLSAMASVTSILISLRSQRTTSLLIHPPLTHAHAKPSVHFASIIILPRTINDNSPIKKSVFLSCYGMRRAKKKSGTEQKSIL